MRRTQVAKLIESNPILQAPMAGITTPELVSEVSNQGGIGQIGAGYLEVLSLEKFIHDVKLQTNRIYGVNLFIPEKAEITNKQLEKVKETIKAKVPQYSDDLPKDIKLIDVFDQHIDLIIKEQVPIVSFTFGLPDQLLIERLKASDIYVIGTATSVAEAIAVEKAGCDAVVVQGSESGGHRGNFLGEDQLIGLMALIPQVVDAVSIPVIAAGGIMDNRGVKAALCLGAATVQIGSAFLMTSESSAPDLHKEALLESMETDMVLTKAFSGKSARGIRNTFIDLFENKSYEILAYPYQNSLTKNLRKLAGQNDDKEYMSLWGGQAVRLSKRQTVKELINELKK
ncbi:MAG TPA: nitronate monooxygenase [Pseudogracilibacillus sp.]|nr:nitronate monooxygenase [Pseudogracilibacillus sp.]